MLRKARAEGVQQAMLNLAIELIVCYSLGLVFVVAFALSTVVAVIGGIGQISVTLAMACYAIGQICSLLHMSSWLRRKCLPQSNVPTGEDVLRQERLLKRIR
jgi:Na+-translocating ferredoxin:NAD+ oxidoreductase RnfD subunit